MAYNSTTFRGAGTEIIRSASFENCANVVQILIVGVQHHIYTVLSLTANCQGVSGTEKGYITLKGYDALQGTTNQDIHLARVVCSVGDTFVWNDKFSFNGYEPLASAMSGTLNLAAEQDAIADQGSSVSQYLKFITDSGSTYYDVHVTYIDQNNA